jgi:cell division septation protein DedD
VKALAAAVALTILAIGRPARAAAQEDPAIQEAVRLAGSGRADSARAIVNAALARARPGDPAYVEALYWRARIAASGDSAERDLLRVAIEFPTSRWADHALLQLAQHAMAAGNPTSAFALAQRLRSDYPGSDLRPLAALWAGRAAFDLGDPRGACALLDSARAEGSADVEFTNRVAFYQARCSNLPPAPAAGGDSAGAPQPAHAAAPPPAPAARPAATPAAVTPRFAIQVAAVRTDAEAGGIVRRLAAAGFTGHVATGSDHLRRVRVGAYATDAEARDALPAVRRAAGGHPFVVRER